MKSTTPFQFAMRECTPSMRQQLIRRDAARDIMWKRTSIAENSFRSLCTLPVDFRSAALKSKSRLRPRSWSTGGAFVPDNSFNSVRAGGSELVRTFFGSRQVPRQSENAKGSEQDDHRNKFSHHQQDDNAISKYIPFNPVIYGSMSEADGISMRDNAEALLQCPVGEIELSAWYDAEDAIKWWISQRTEESVSMSMNLLKRFVEEAKVSEDAKSNILVFFQNNVLIELVFNWFSVWKENTKTKWTPARLLETLRIYEATVPEMVRISWKIDAYLINAMSHGCDPKQVAPLANDLLHQFFDHREKQPHDYLSNYLSNITMRLWGRSNLSGAVERSEAIYFRMKAENVRLDIVTFNTLLDVYAQQGLAEEAELLLDALSRDYEQGSTKIRPDEMTLSSVVHAWSKSNDPNAVERAQKLLNRVMDPLDVFGQIDIAPELVSHNHLLTCWARSNRNDAGEKALHHLTEMQSIGLDPDHISYGIVTNALAKSGNVARAEEVVSELCEKYEIRKEQHLRPTVLLFTTLMDAWFKSGLHGREAKMLEIFEWTKKLFKEGVLEEGPDTRMHNVVLRLIVSGNEDDRVSRADEFLQVMTTLGLANGWSYTEVILAYIERLKDLNDLNRAEEILETAFEDKDVVLSVRCFARVIFELAKANKPAKADAWLHKVFDRFEAGLFPDGESPAASLLGGVVASWHRAADTDKSACMKAEALVNRMIDLENKGLVKEGPDHVLKTLIILYSRSSNQDRADRAHAILQQMRQRASRGQVKAAPDSGTINAVIAMSIQTGNIQLAETVLRHMVQDFLAEKSKAKPDRRLLNYLLKSMARSSDPRAFERAYALLMEMHAISQNHEIAIRPNRDSFHHVLAAASKHNRYANDIEKIVKAMKESFSNGNTSCRPTYFTYITVIRIFCRGGKPSEAEMYLREACSLYQRGELSGPPPADVFDIVIEIWDRHYEAAQNKDQGSKKMGILSDILGSSSDTVIGRRSPDENVSSGSQEDTAKCIAKIREMKDFFYP